MNYYSNGTYQIKYTEEGKRKYKNIIEYIKDQNIPAGIEEKDLIDLVTLIEEYKTVHEISDGVKEYKKRLEGIWDKYGIDINNIFSAILGKEFYYNQLHKAPEETIIFATDPTTAYGGCGYPGYIIMGNVTHKLPEEIKKDETKEDKIIAVYLAHEMCHAKIFPFTNWRDNLNFADNLHCFIQYLADKELNYQLTGEDYTTLPSHYNLYDQMSQMYPYFLAYLYRNSENQREEIMQAMRRDRDIRADAAIDEAIALARQNDNPYDFVNAIIDKQKKVVNVQELGKQSIGELSNVSLLDETEQQMEKQENQIKNQSPEIQNT